MNKNKLLKNNKSKLNDKKYNKVKNLKGDLIKENKDKKISQENALKFNSRKKVNANSVKKLSNSIESQTETSENSIVIESNLESNNDSSTNSLLKFDNSEFINQTSPKSFNDILNDSTYESDISTERIVKELFEECKQDEYLDNEETYQSKAKNRRNSGVSRFGFVYENDSPLNKVEHFRENVSINLDKEIQNEEMNEIDQKDKIETILFENENYNKEHKSNSTRINKKIKLRYIRNIIKIIGKIPIRLILLFINSVKILFIFSDRFRKMLHSKIFWHYCSIVAVHGLMMVCILCALTQISKDIIFRNLFERISIWILTIPVPLIIFFQIISKTIETYRFCKIYHEFEDEASKAVTNPSELISNTLQLNNFSDWDFMHPSLLKRPIKLISELFNRLRIKLNNFFKKNIQMISKSTNTMSDLNKDNIRKTSINLKGTSSIQKRRAEFLEEQLDDKDRQIDNLEKELDEKNKSLSNITEKNHIKEIELQDLRKRIASNIINIEILSQKIDNQKSKIEKLNSYNTFLKEENEKLKQKQNKMESEHMDEIKKLKNLFETRFSNLVDEQRKVDFEWLEQEFRKMYEDEILFMKNKIYTLENKEKDSNKERIGIPKKRVTFSQLHDTHPSIMSDSDYENVLFADPECLLAEDISNTLNGNPKLDC